MYNISMILLNAEQKDADNRILEWYKSETRQVFVLTGYAGTGKTTLLKHTVVDTLGLALFTVVGVGKSLSLGYPFWVAIIMGSMTGAAGGVIRDVFINEIPLIFRKEIYAMACVVGGLVYWVCALAQMDDYICQIACGVVVFLTRILAVKYKICLPTLSGHA